MIDGAGNRVGHFKSASKKPGEMEFEKSTGELKPKPARKGRTKKAKKKAKKANAKRTRRKIKNYPFKA